MLICEKKVMKIDNILLDNLTAQAQVSPRLRMNLDLRNSDADCSQRMLNAIEPGSVVPIHRHQKTSETVVVLRGRVVEEYYSSDGAVEATFELAAGGPVCITSLIPVSRMKKEQPWTLRSSHDHHTTSPKQSSLKSSAASPSTTSTLANRQPSPTKKI